MNRHDSDDLKRESKCASWTVRSEVERWYHDEEWGVIVTDDDALFQCLMLECMQAGLSWTTIMKRREGIVAAFHGLKIQRCSVYSDADLEVFMKDERVIRHALKIQAVRKNARACLALQKEFPSFYAYIWSFTEGKPVVGHWLDERDIPSRTALSDKIAKDMKKRGFSFVGSTTVYAWLQAIGVVNDHLVSCERYRMLMEGGR